MTPDDWTAQFLERRDLAAPDGRALYAYRCTGEEFNSLATVLRGPLERIAKPHFRAFVLYAALWWQRHYAGARWSWEPLLASINWSVAYQDLYQGVRIGWRWWRIQPVRLPSSIRFLGTFACHGGLPLALVGDATAPVTRYLRAVLSHALEYRRFVDDAIDLARDKEHLLRPPTLRRDYVFRLAADLVDAVLELRTDARADNPIAALDAKRPDWRQSMPLDLENALARDLLVGLLHDARQLPEGRVAEFRVDRFLRLTSVGWRLGARVLLPARIESGQLAQQLGVKSPALPARMEVRVLGDGVHVAGVYVHRDDDEGGGEYLLAGRQAPLELWDGDAAGEIRLVFVAGKAVGNGVIPARGACLTDLPWVFRGDEQECQFIGEGTVGSRASEIVALVPKDVSLPVGYVNEGEVRGRVLLHIHSRVSIETEAGPCTINPGAEHVVDDYRLRGERWYDLDSPLPLFRGTPTLLVSKSDGPPKSVPPHEVQWRRLGGEWQRIPGNGLWQIRHCVGDEVRFLARVGILPLGMSMQLEPGNTVSEGSLAFAGAENVRIAAAATVHLERHQDDHVVRARLRAIDAHNPPTVVGLKLHWPGATELLVEAPFPGCGGRFLREGQPVTNQVAVSELYGVRAVAVSPQSTDQFWIEGELKAVGLGALVRVAHFRVPLRRTGPLHELPLIDVRTPIDLLLTGSASADARVFLRIVNGAGVEQCALTVSQFSAALEFDPSQAIVSLPPSEANGGTVSFEALSLPEPHSAPLSLNAVGSDGCSAILPPNQLAQPWLIVARREG